MIGLLITVCSINAFALDGGALDGERYRVIVSSDIGGGDEDDMQSMIHYLIYSDLFDTEGFVSSPPKDGTVDDFLRFIDVYEKDYPKLKSHSEDYPTPDYLRSITKQGHLKTAPEQGYSQSNEGSDWIIKCAKKDDPRPLYVLVWGSITDVAQAIHDDPSIKDKIRVYFIASWNQRQDPHAARFIEEHHPDTWMIYCDTTFRGWYNGGNQDGDLGNKTFIQEHIAGHGALGEEFTKLKAAGVQHGAIKMGDTPSVAYLLKGNPDDPSSPHWGGNFAKVEGRPNWWTDRTDPELKVGNYPGAKTVSKWREDYLRNWQKRMDRCLN